MTKIEHKKLLELAHQLGYLSYNTAGLCAGITLRWIEATYTNEEEQFKQRLDLMLTDSSLIEKINQVRDNQRQHPHHPSPDETDLLEVLAFFESLAIYQNPAFQTDLFDRALIDKSLTQISQFASSDAMKSQGGLNSIYSEVTAYTLPRLIHYLNELADIIKNSNGPNNTKMTFTIDSRKHLIGFSYHLDSDSWRFMNINHSPPIEENKNSAEIAALIFQEYTRNPACPWICLNISAIVPTNLNTNEQLEIQLQKLKQAHPLNRDLVQSGAGSELAWLAAKNGHQDVIITLHELGIDINVPTKDETPLFAAAYNGYVDVITTLYKFGADINRPDNKMQTPFLVAVCNGQLDVAIKLRELGANIHTPNIDGITPIWAAAQNGDINLIATLHNFGANISTSNNNGTTPLHIAAQKGHVNAVIKLFELGAQIDITDEEGRTPLWLAAGQGHTDVIVKLREQGAMVNKINNEGRTPIWIAAYQGHIDTIVKLHELGGDIHMPDDLGITPAWIAAQNGHIGVILKLHELGASINQSNTSGVSSLDVARQHGHTKIITTISRLINIDIKQQEGGFVSGPTMEP